MQHLADDKRRGLGGPDLDARDDHGGMVHRRRGSDPGCVALQVSRGDVRGVEHPNGDGSICVPIVREKERRPAAPE